MFHCWIAVSQLAQFHKIRSLSLFYLAILISCNSTVVTIYHNPVEHPTQRCHNPIQMLLFTNTSSLAQLTHYLLIFLLFLFSILTGSSADAITKIVTVTAAPSSPTSPTYLSLSDFKNAVLAMTNTYRSQHNATSLVWNDALVAYAKNWAKSCMWKHSVSPVLYYLLMNP